MKFKILPIFVGTVLSVWAQSAEKPGVPSDDEIRKILAERVDIAKQAVGIVAGVIDQKGRRIVSYGSLAKGDNRPLNGDTVFEIGSTTKVFTSLVLTDMVRRGEVALTDPVSKYLPEQVKVPQRNGRSITLQDLATHTSGLPRMPTVFKPKDVANPYSDYSVEQLFQFLSGYELTRDIGTQYEYSNIGVGLLGVALARRAGTDYETLVRTRICDPLKMTSTRIKLTDDMKARLATGHNGMLAPVSNWDLTDAVAGAGALRSTANDILTFLSATLGYTESPLAPAMAAMLDVRRPTGNPNLEIALGWHIFKKEGQQLIWHNGGTGGYRSFMGYDPKARTGVVVLANAMTPAGVDDIGRHLLDSKSPLLDLNSPLLKAPKERKEVTVDPKLFDRYVGRYQMAPTMFLTFSREGDQLFGQLTGQDKYQVFPESDREFFYKVVDAQLTFEVAPDGKPAAVVLHQGGRDIRMKRIEGEPEMPKTVAVDAAVFDRYVGRYELVPQFVMTISREGTNFYLQATGQPRLEIFPESQRKFFLKVVDAQVTFEGPEGERATGLVLHQNGMDQKAKRIE